MIPQTRVEFKEYCLRALGKGVLQINVSDEQCEDRLDEAFYLYQQFHMDAVGETYLAHQATGSTMMLDSNSASFLNGESITGGTSLAKGFIINSVNSTS